MLLSQTDIYYIRNTLYINIHTDMDKEEHFPEKEVQRTHTATCLI